MLVRARAWWFNKVPLSVTSVLLLLDGRQFSAGALAVLALIVLTVCAVGNYGYAVNDLFDIEEDTRLNRGNAAVALGKPHMWGIIGISALCTAAFATTVAGLSGTFLTLVELSLPLAYSVPPLRLKERKWLGLAADGLAAHVYPAVLALLAVDHWNLHHVTTALALSIVVWSAAAGLRGILSHQLHTADQDAGAGLRTIVHDFGRRRVERFLVFAVLPLEGAAFLSAIIVCDVGPVLWIFVGLYAIYEIFKTVSGRFRVTAFRAEGQPYVPLIEESFYKAWGPVVLALDAARVDILYLAVIPAYVLLFLTHARIEIDRFRAVIAALRVTSTREPCARSNEES